MKNNQSLICTKLYHVSCSGHFVVRGLVSAVQYVLDFLKCLAFGLWQQKRRKQQRQYTAHGKYPKYRIYADGIGHRAKQLCQYEAQKPAETGR